MICAGVSPESANIVRTAWSEPEEINPFAIAAAFSGVYPKSSYAAASAPASFARLAPPPERIAEVRLLLKSLALSNPSDNAAYALAGAVSKACIVPATGAPTIASVPIALKIST